MNRAGWTAAGAGCYRHRSGWRIAARPPEGRWVVVSPDGREPERVAEADPARAAARAERRASGVRYEACGTCQRDPDARMWTCTGCAAQICAHKGGGDDSGIPGVPHVPRCKRCAAARRRNR